MLEDKMIADELEEEKTEIIPCTILGEKWMWHKGYDGGGYLESPDGKSYMIYDLATHEYKYEMSDELYQFFPLNYYYGDGEDPSEFKPFEFMEKDIEEYLLSRQKRKENEEIINNNGDFTKLNYDYLTIEQRQEIIDKKVIQNFEAVKKVNHPMKLDVYSQLLGGVGAVFSRDDYLFMLQLGVPIGVVEYRDSKNNLIIREDDEIIGEVTHIYKPINSLKEYAEYQEINGFPYVIVNPTYMSNKEVRNLAYCFLQANNDEVFDIYTKDKLQFETIISSPIKYDEAIKIFNKYFNESIHKKYINEYGVGREQFYYLSGLKELVPPSKNINQKDKGDR